MTIVFKDKSPRIASSVLDIAASMQRREVIGVRGHMLMYGIVNSLEAEDGSGRCFNVYFSDGTWTFVRFE